MPAIKCKACGKQWTDVQGYAADKGCNKHACPHTKPLNQVPAEVPYLDTKFRSEGDVISYFDDTKAALFLDVPKVISMEIFPPGCRAKRKPMKAAG